MSFPKRKQAGASFPWVQKKLSISNPFPRYGHSASQNAINGEFFLFGGIARGKLRNEVFSVEVNTLNVLAFVASGEMPTPRSGHTHVSIGTNVIVFGGLTDESTDETDENLYILDTVSKVWNKPSIHGSPPLSRHGHSATVIGTKMYVFGGQHEGRYLNDLITFDLKSLNFTGTYWDFIIPRVQSPPGRSGHVSFAYKENIYIFGGIGENKCLNDVWCYDTQANTWTELLCTGYIPTPRYNHGSTIVDDVIYVFGGRTYEGTELGDLTAFRISNQRWYMFQKMGPAPASRFGHTMTTAGDKILVFGGESINSPKPDEEGIIHVLDTSKIKYPTNPQQTQQGTSHQRQQQTTSQYFPQPQQQSPNEVNFNNNSGSPTRDNLSAPTSPQSLIINNGTPRPRHIIPTARQSSIPRSRSEDEQFYSPKSSIDDVRTTLQFQQGQNSRSMSSQGSPRMPLENSGGGTYSLIPPGHVSLQQQQQKQQQQKIPSPQPHHQSMLLSQQGYPRGPAGYPQRQTIGGTSSSRGIPVYDLNAIVMSNSKGNPPEQITYMERSISPQQRSLTPSVENLRKKTPSPFGGVSKPPHGSDNFQQQQSTKKQFEDPRKAPRPPNPNINTTDNQNNSVPHSGMTGVKGNNNGGSLMSPPTPSSPVSASTNTMPPSPMPYEEVNSSSSNISPTETSDTVDHSSVRIERDDFMRELQQRDQTIAAFKKREMWFRAELALARKSGYTLDSDIDSTSPDDIDIEHLLDMGDSTSEKYKVLETIMKLRQEIRKSKASITSQAQIASQKVTDSERTRTSAIQEAAYSKAKLTAIINSSESELATIEIKRAKDLEKRLTQALTEKEDIQNKYIQSQQDLRYEKSSRESAEEQAKVATTRAEEAEESHAHALAELATLHSRATTAESSLRETKAKLTETSADLTHYRSGSDGIQLQLIKLQQSVEQHKRALEKANDALTAANERSGEFESLWNQSKQDISNLEKESAGLRVELDIKMKDLDRSKSRTIEIERLLEKARKESESMRTLMQETKLLDNNPSQSNPVGSDISDYLNVTDKLKLVEQELSELKTVQIETQKIADETSNNLSESKVQILQLESSVMKSRSESAVLQRRLGESGDEIIKIKVRLRETERSLDEKTRALEEAEVKAGMMRNVMSERGILEESGNSSNFTGSQQALRYKEMEARCEKLENMHAKTQDELKASIKKYKDALQKVKAVEDRSKILEGELERTSSDGSKSVTPDLSSNQALEDELKVTKATEMTLKQRLDDSKQKLSQLESDYKTATHYVKGTEKMLRRMKEELTRSKSEGSKLKQKLSDAQNQNETLEDKIAELENQISLQKGFRASRQDFENVKQVITQQEEFSKEKEVMKKKILELSKQVEQSQEKRSMSDQSYEALKKEYDKIRKDHKLLRQTSESLEELFAKSESEVNVLKGELEETLSLNELLNQQLDEALANNGNINEKRFSVINRDQLVAEQQKWKAQREILEQQVEEIKEANQQLQNENIELGSRLQDSDSKITLLLDQLEAAVDSYQGPEDEINETSPRDSRISAITNELDILKSQFKINNETDNGVDNLNRASSRLEGYDEIMANLDAVQKAAAERSRPNIDTN